MRVFRMQDAGFRIQRRESQSSRAHRAGGKSGRGADGLGEAIAKLVLLSSREPGLLLG